MERVKYNYIVLPLLISTLTGCDPKTESTNAPEKPIVQQIAPSDANIIAGKDIHDKNCISCHDSASYSRPDRHLTSYPELLNLVQRCNGNLAERLYDQELQQIALYLNKTYYQFNQP